MSQNSKNYAKVLHKLFGIPLKYFEKTCFIETRKAVRITSNEYLEEASLLGATSGVKILKKGKFLNPSSNIVFLFFKKLKGKGIELNKTELIELFEKGKIKKPIRKKGYAVVTYNSLPLALVFLKDDEIECMMPKEFREEMIIALKEKEK